MIQRDAHSPFRFATVDELRNAIEELGLSIAVEEDTSYLKRTVNVAGRIVPNSMAVHPMEGCDGTPEGAPGPLTFRRYKRFAAGGAGLLWFEACAVVAEGRANPRQIMLTTQTRDEFARLLDESLRAAAESMGPDHRPLTVLQLTHSGRYSRPVDAPRPVIAHRDPLLDKDKGLPSDYPLISDDELERLEDAYVQAAKLAFEIGFDAVDIKSCHRYLINELLAAHTREGRYGGSYENRTRLLRNVVGKVMAIAPRTPMPPLRKGGHGGGAFVTCRLGIHDSHPYPHGWGMSATDPTAPDLSEPKRLVRELSAMGMPLINITMGNPYFRPHVNRPYDRPVEGAAYPDEHPLVSVDRLIRFTREVQQHVPEIAVVGSGFSWLRNLWPYVASAGIRDGGMRMVGLGRQSFAYPGFAKEIVDTGRLQRRHTCIGCSCCTQIMRDGGTSGCVPFDSEVYGPIYREGRRNSLDYAKAQAARCRDCFDPTCRDGCPAGVDIPAFVTALASGDIKRSYEVLRQSNALPEICAYVCPAEVQCQASCVENIFSQHPVPIRDLQKYVCRAARKAGWTTEPIGATASGKRVAVIGAGPAGLACASSLAAMGHEVHLFDQRPSLGGVAAGAIPSKRLKTTDADIEALSALGDGVTFHPQESLSEIRGLDDFAADFDAVFLGIGLGGSMVLTESRPAGVEDAISFLERAKAGSVDVPERVAVIGGGNTAMDAATTALTLGANDVYLIYRRSFAEMPAWPADRDEALNMGVHFLLLTQPVGYESDSSGRLSGVRVARTVLGEPDASGRRRPVAVPNSESVIAVEMALEAIGQQLPLGFESLIPGIKLTGKRLVDVDGEGRTSREGVFAGGDVINGGATVVQAVADGMRAARAINTWIS
jgi:2,4-dienoyl-CoA reductase (NADPH2)